MPESNALLWQVLVRRELEEAAKVLGERIRTNEASSEVHPRATARFLYSLCPIPQDPTSAKPKVPCFFQPCMMCGHTPACAWATLGAQRVCGANRDLPKGRPG